MRILKSRSLPFLILFILSIVLIMLIINTNDSKTIKNGIPIATEEVTSVNAIIKQAEYEASQYNYDKAIEILVNINDTKYKALIEKHISDYQENKNQLVEYPLEKITHIFFHTLIYDCSKAFDGDRKEAGYNQVMTTVEEFKSIINQMYEKGYVLVDIHDIAGYQTDAAGNQVWTEKKIKLPPDKKAFVLSQDDVCYYEYMAGDGFANKMVIDDNNNLTCAYLKDDGSVTYGAYDIVPIIEDFIKDHPDFSYHGARGILALTGYNGILGYRTDEEYREKLGDVLWQEEIEKAKKTSNALKKAGWRFASHSWGHLNMRDASYDNFVADTDKWEKRVESIIGDCDVLIYPFGADIGDFHPYDFNNPKLSYLYNKGFRYFCNVDSNTSWLQISDNSMRQGRRNLDGYRMYYDMIDDNIDRLSDLFDVNNTFDKLRPVPVPPM